MIKKTKQKTINKRTPALRKTKSKKPANDRAYETQLRSFKITGTLAAKVSEELQPVFKVIFNLDKFLARVFAQLEPPVQMRTARGLVGHLRACAKNENNPDPQAIREIITDAKIGKFIFEENKLERAYKRPLETRSYFEVYK